MKYPLSYNTWTGVERGAIAEVVESGNLTMGKKVAEFETEFAKYVGTRYAVMVNSGSSANLLAVAALFYTQEREPLKRGDEVIVPAISWATTYAPLQQYGLKLRFVDINPQTMNIDNYSLIGNLNKNTKAIFAVNLLGNPCEYAAINGAIQCTAKNIILLEDNCESLSAEINGKRTGSFGLMGTHSFYFSHHINTIEGGMITTDDEELYHILLCLRAHGWTRNLPDKNKVSLTKYGNPFDESFNFVLPGYNLRPTEIQGAIGLVQLERLPEFIKQRTKNMEYFEKVFDDHPWLWHQIENGQSSSFGFALVLHDTHISRDDLVMHLQAHEIATRPIVARNFLIQPVIKFYDYVKPDLPERIKLFKYADMISEKGFYVGNYPYDLTAQIDYLYETINNIL